MVDPIKASPLKQEIPLTQEDSQAERKSPSPDGSSDMSKTSSERDSPDLPSQPIWVSRHLWQITPVQDIFWVGLAIALLWFGYHVRSVMIPILIGLGLAYAVNPLLTYAENRWNLPRPVPIGIILGTLTLIIAAVCYFVTPIVVDEVQTLSDKTPQYIKTITSRLDGDVEKAWVDQIEAYRKQLPANGVDLAKFMTDNIGNAVGFVGQVMSTTVYMLVSLFLIPIYFFFFAWHFGPIVSRMRRYIPHAHRHRVLKIVKRMDDAVGNFLRGRVIIVGAMMVMFSIGFWVAGVPYWFMLGTLTGLLSFVPYLAVIGCGLAIGASWIDAAAGNGGSMEWMHVFVWPTVAYSVVQLLEGWILTPWIQSDSMEMSAVTVLIVVFIGGAVGGVYGLLLAIPIAACTRILAEEVLIPKLETWANDA